MSLVGFKVRDLMLNTSCWLLTTGRTRTACNSSSEGSRIVTSCRDIRPEFWLLSKLGLGVCTSSEQILTLRSRLGHGVFTCSQHIWAVEITQPASVIVIRRSLRDYQIEVEEVTHWTGSCWRLNRVGNSTQPQWNCTWGKSSAKIAYQHSTWSWVAGAEKKRVHTDSATVPESGSDLRYSCFFFSFPVSL